MAWCGVDMIGKFCRSLDQGVTTHLIALEPSGDKYEHALSWNIHVCSPDWIHECVKLKCYFYFDFL